MRQFNAWLKIITLSIIMTIVGCTSSHQWLHMEGQHPQSFSAEIMKTVRYDVLVYLPAGFARTDTARPLILFLHGSGERGSDPNSLKVHSLPKIVEGMKDFPFIVVSPQCPEGERWNAESLNAMLDEVVQQLPVDTNRIYLTGLSMGGFGVWKLAIASPHRFAAIAPVCGWGHLEDVGKLRSLPVWVFHGAKDDVVPPSESEKMVQFLRKHGNTNVLFTLYPDANHNAWDATYADPNLYEWFLQHKRSQ